MNTSEILTHILMRENMSVQDFANAINYPVTKLYDIKQGRTKKFNEDLIELISDKYPNYSRIFLLTGVADCEKTNLVNPHTEPMYDNNNDNITRLINEISTQREMSDKHITRAFDIIKHFQEQTDRMITLLENYNK